MITPMRCMTCHGVAPDGAFHECSQSRMHHDDIPGTVVSDNTGGEWQNLRLPLDYETKPKERFFMCKSCAGTFFAMWKEESGLCLTCDIERDLTKKEPIC